nr:hypothetical protein [Propioniciclava sp. MC1595]
MTKKARGAESSREDTLKIHRIGEERSSPSSEKRHHGPAKGTRFRSFGSVLKTGNRFAVRYTGPDRKHHTASITFSNEVRAQTWLGQELGLIERGEWTPPAVRRKLAEAEAITFDGFAREWIDKRLVRGRPLKDRSKEHYLDIHERWFAPFHDLPLTSITTADVERWFHSRPEAPTMRTHAYSLLKAIFRIAVASRPRPGCRAGPRHPSVSPRRPESSSWRAADDSFTPTISTDLPSLAYLVAHGVQGGDGRGVPDVAVGEVDDEPIRVAQVVELVDQIVAGGEEHLAAHLVRAHPGRGVGVRQRFDGREARDPAREHDDHGVDADDDSVGEVPGGDRDAHGEQHDQVSRSAACGAGSRGGCCASRSWRPTP